MKKYAQISAYQSHLVQQGNSFQKIVGSVFWFSFVLNHVLVLYVGGSMVSNGSLAAAELNALASLINDASWKLYSVITSAPKLYNAMEPAGLDNTRQH
jgi:hypothetical protein